jgi:hypothetical protein
VQFVGTLPSAWCHRLSCVPGFSEGDLLALFAAIVGQFATTGALEVSRVFFAAKASQDGASGWSTESSL